MVGQLTPPAGDAPVLFFGKVERQVDRFTSLDPLVSQTLQPYAYAGGDPVDEVDPTGTAFYEGDTEASWDNSGLQWCIGVDAVVTAQVCKTFTIGAAFLSIRGR